MKSDLVLAVLCGLLILSGCRPSATDWRWDRAEAGLPHQAVFLALAADPDDPTRLWAGYYAPGGLATSHDGGQTWITDAEGLGDNPVFDLLPLPGGPLWAATRDGLLGSMDGGASWHPTADGLPPATAFALATDKAGHVYIGLDGAGLYVGEGGGWAPLAHDESLASAAVLSLAVSPDGGQLYAGTAGRGLFASRDAGRTWTTAFSRDYVPNLALNPLRPTTAVASLRDRLVRTDDGGESWNVLPLSWARDEVVSLLWLADPLMGTGGTLWAGTGRGRVYCSEDNGDSWVAHSSPSEERGGVLALATAGDRLLAGTWTGVYAAPVLGGCDGSGQSWTYLTPSLGVPYANELLVADTGLLLGTRAGLFRWQSAVRRWERVPAECPRSPHRGQGEKYSKGGGFPPGGVTALALHSPGVVYAGTAAEGLYRSNDGGASWVCVPSDLAVGIRALVVAPGDADRVYILAAWERMYESHDGGQSWQARWIGLGVTTEAVSLAIDPVDPLTLYLGADTGLYRSRHGGEDWRPVGRPLDDQTVLTLRVEPRGPQVKDVATPFVLDAEEGDSILYIGATRGAYRSYDGGDTVERWGRGLEHVSITAFLFDPDDPQVIYAGTAYAGVYRSTDRGETWQAIGPDELADDVVETMAWGPEGGLFVASAGGVWVGVER